MERRLSWWIEQKVFFSLLSYTVLRVYYILEYFIIKKFREDRHRTQTNEKMPRGGTSTGTVAGYTRIPLSASHAWYDREAI